MQVSTEYIKVLREKTGAGIMQCKRALQEANGNIEAAISTLKESGYAIAKKKVERVACQGIVESYIHGGGRIGALVEVNCESDFVARTPEFIQLAHDVAMQVVATNPRFTSADEIKGDEEATDEDCLLKQPFIKDPSKTVQDIITEVVAKVRENIQIRRFVRFELGSDGRDE